MNRFHKVSFDEYSKYYTEDDERNIQEIYDEIKLPVRGTKKSAGYDFRCPVTINCKPNVGYMIPTGICCEMDNNVFLQVNPRSSLGMKYGFKLTNTTGIIDADYYGNSQNGGHIFVGFTVDNPITINAGDKLCQGIFVPFLTTVDDTATGDRTGGMGSTGA